MKADPRAAPIVRELEQFIFERFSFKNFYDSYIILKCDGSRRGFVLEYVRNRADDFPKRVSPSVVETVTDLVIDFMEAELDRLESKGKI